MSIEAVSSTSTNLCPHGLPPAACPECSGGAGGNKKLHSRPVQKSKEWSYAKCYSVWQAMKAAQAMKDAEAQRALRQFETAKTLQTKLNNIIAKFQNLAQSVAQMLPQNVRGVFMNVFNSVMTPLMNLISKLPQTVQNIQNFLNDVRLQILATSEKLTAIFGEIKNFVERKIAQKYKKLTKSLLRLFVFNLEDENYANDEELAVFKSRELRKIKYAIESITRKGTEYDENSTKTH